MKAKKLVRKLAEQLDRTARRRARERAALTELLDKLRAKEAELEGRIAGETDPEKVVRQRRKLALLQAQRHKGERLLAGEPAAGEPDGTG